MENLLFKNSGNTFEYKEVDDGYIHLKGYASTFGNIDRVGDIVEKDAFSLSLTQRMPKLLNQHKADEPLGVIDRAYANEIGLIIEARMPKDNAMVKNLIPLLKMGAISDFSIGYSVVDAEINDDGVRILKEVDLWEVSLVTFPANTNAKILSVKSVVPFKDLPIGDESTAWNSTSAIKRIKTFTKSDESPSNTYKNAFLWYDAANADNFTAYKLPIADVIDGRLVALPKAIFAAAAAINGARGGVDIPDNEKQSIINNLKKYYKKMDMDSPFEKSGNIEMDDKIIDAMTADSISTKKEFEDMLESTGLFTKKARYILAAKFNEDKARGEPDAKKTKRSESVNIKELLEAIEQTKNKLNKKD